MAVTSIALVRDSISGERSLNGERSYTASFRAITNDANDNVVTVTNAFLSTIAAMGSSYAIGNDSDSLAFLDSVRPQRDSQSATLWTVAATWVTPTFQQTAPKIDDNGNPSTNPLDFRDEISIRPAQYQRPVYEAIFHGVTADFPVPIGAVGIAMPNRALLSAGAVQNSANTVLDPAPDKDESRQELLVAKNLANFPDQHAKDYQDAVNSDLVIWNWPGISLVVPPLTAKLQSIGGSLRFENNISFWRVEYVIHIDYRHGWRDVIVDRGLHAKAIAGDPDGKGGTLPGSPSGQPDERTLCDERGNPLIDPVLLNGAGQPVPAGSPTRYLIYQYYNELPFAALALDS